MKNDLIREYSIDHIQIYAPMAKLLAYWHKQALGFTTAAYAGAETGRPGISSYVVTSGDIRIEITSAYPTSEGPGDSEVARFIEKNYCGVRSIALRVDSVEKVFARCLAAGAVPMRFPAIQQDDDGIYEDASIKLYDDNEIILMNRERYSGVFKPGYRRQRPEGGAGGSFTHVDHIASELRMNQIEYWTAYLTRTIGTRLVQNITGGGDNKAGMIMNINQSADKMLTLVMAEPESHGGGSKVQRNIDRFGPGIHHLAFATDDLLGTVERLRARGVEFVDIPPAYYQLLRMDAEMRDLDVDRLESLGILVDKEDGKHLFQKFIRPISDRPFFLYEIVQRVNGYEGFALKNINVLKRAEELEIMKAGQ